MSATLRRRILSPQERERLRNEARSLEHRMQGGIVVEKNWAINEPGFSERRQGYLEQHMRKDVHEDKGLLQKKLRHVNRVLSDGTPPPLSAAERARLEKQVAQDREFLSKNMAPRNLYYAKANSPEFETAKKAASREFTPEFQRVADRYTQSLRALDPDDADRNHIEKLRPS